MPPFGSLLLIAGGDEALRTRAESMLGTGWTVVRQSDPAAISAFALGSQPAAILVDANVSFALGTVAAIRLLPPPANGTPILTLGGTSPLSGAGGHIATLFSEAEFLALLRQWAGPLDDHALRAEPWNFRYRLIRLIGLENGDAMLRRLRDALMQVVDGAAGEPNSPHRLAGIAGLCGFPELGRLWTAVDRGEDDALPPAIEGSRRCIAQIARELRET